MRKVIMALSALTLTAPTFLVSTAADAHPRGCRKGGTTGAIIGGVGGALLGRTLDGGRSKAVGTILGAGAGALAGREIERRRRCR